MGIYTLTSVVCNNY